MAEMDPNMLMGMFAGIFAIAFAVTMLSPVTILTVIPAPWHFLMASGTSFLGSSLTPIIAIKVMLSF